MIAGSRHRISEFEDDQGINLGDYNIKRVKESKTLGVITVGSSVVHLGPKCRNEKLRFSTMIFVTVPSMLKSCIYTKFWERYEMDTVNYSQDNQPLKLRSRNKTCYLMM